MTKNWASTCSSSAGTTKKWDIERAIELARRLSDLQGVEKDEANKLLQKLNLLS